MNRTKYHRTAARLVLGAAMAGSLLALPLANQATTYSYTDLNPSGFTTSEAYGISGGQQAGYGNGSATGTNTHALLWSSTATNVVDLNPSGFTNSLALGLCGSQQVGHGYGPATGGNQHALFQFEPDLGGTWSNWPGGLFSPTDVTNSQYLFITNGIGFFRLQYVP
jgi:hypothetical protein